jgi:hypothetical protein
LESIRALPSGGTQVIAANFSSCLTVDMLRIRRGSQIKLIRTLTDSLVKLLRIKRKPLNESS